MRDLMVKRGKVIIFFQIQDIFGENQCRHEVLFCFGFKGQIPIRFSSGLIFAAIASLRMFFL